MANRFQLFINTASPYARKARILIREKGLLAQVDEHVVTPLENPTALVAVNPLVQIPTLVASDALILSDSYLIGQWIDAHFGRLEVLANGMLEMLVKMVLENRRPESERSPSWLARWEGNLLRSLDIAEAQIWGEGFDMAKLTLGIALSYVDFRYPHIEWKAAHPKLAALQALCEARQSFIDTYPK